MLQEITRQYEQLKAEHDVVTAKLRESEAENKRQLGEINALLKEKKDNNTEQLLNQANAKLKEAADIFKNLFAISP